jgi:hypothetical protein
LAYDADPVDASYVKIKQCERCGRKLLKGYFLIEPDRLRSGVLKVVCWRCKLFRRSTRSVSDR